MHGFEGDTKNSSFSRFMAVLWAIPHYSGVPTLFLGLMTPGTWFHGDTTNSSFSRFMAVSRAIPHCFGVPMPFLGLVNIHTLF
jgi:hypothetical protein